jgi:superfamily I DNA/RNA helicase
MGGTLPTPSGQQREVVYLRERGHCIVLGTAGSGKTVMAVNRAAYLAEAPQFGGPTLLVTFNGALVTYLRSLVGDKKDVTVEQYHLFAKNHVETLTGDALRICEHEMRRHMVSTALRQVRGGSNRRRSVLDRPVDFFLDEFYWLAGQGIVDFSAYLSGAVKRVGRGTPLAPEDRAVVHDVYQAYLVLRAKRGYNQDWGDLAGALLRALENGTGSLPFRHVVIDEGQDFSPEMIRSLVAAVPSDGSVTFFGDYAQQIYGSRISWRSLGLQVARGRLVRFEQNYRNTRQIAGLAKAIANTLLQDGVDLVDSKEPVADGMRPMILRVESKEAQIEQAAKFANNLVFNRKTRDVMRRVAVLTRTAAFRDQLEQRLEKRRTRIHLHKGMKNWVSGPGIFYGSYEDARGLEFDSVILPLCDDDELPSPRNVEAFGVQEAEARQARELYIAVTRARTELVLLHGERMTRLLPDEESGLYERLDP